MEYVAVDAAIVDGPDTVILFNAPNFVTLQFSEAGANDDHLLGPVKSIWNDWPFLRGTQFANGFNAAFRIPGSSRAYVFVGGNYALIDIQDQCIVEGPKKIWDGWQSLRTTAFVDGIDAVFPSSCKDEYYMFRNDHYAVVNLVEDRIIQGPLEIGDGWPSLKGTKFESGIDAAFVFPDKEEVYMFRGDHYVLVAYEPGTTNDRIVSGPGMIRNAWPSVRSTCFDV